MRVPDFIRDVVEQVAFCARDEKKIDKRSGVSQRLPISVLENVVSNAERRALYAERAAAQKVPVDAIGRIYAAEILRKLPPGSWVLGEDGRWRQK